MRQVASPRVVTGLDEGSGRAVASPRTLSIDDDQIVAVVDGISPGAELVEGWLVPGYVDTHNHGAAGSSYVNPDLTAVRRAIDHHRRHGTTTLVASTVTESIDDVLRQVRQLRGLVESGELAGIHLEGPFISEVRKGAHDAERLRDPEPEMIEQIVQAGGPALTMVTLAPELPHGLEAVRTLAAAGVAPAFGHSDADEQQVREAVDAGCTVVTHLFNAMRGIHHRAPGPIPYLLLDPCVVLELICDGTHVHPDVVAMVVRAAGVDRVALVTDSMSATGQADGDHLLGGRRVQVRDGVARIATDDGSPGPIAGSTLTMAKAVEFVVSKVGVSVAEAAVMAATTPARLHGFDDVGVLAPGRRADLCLVDDAGRLQRVMWRGHWLEGDRLEGETA